ncbi:DUF5343 domain-containing protein [bacterium AH-315-J23]|nr:DUF5343 domain-containing protein [bacterium AH-315-J23]
MKNGAIASYFDAILNASAPTRFSYKFIEGLGFKSTNDRLLISILKDLGFLNSDGAPEDRYFKFLDKSKSAQVLAEGITEAYSDLFAVNLQAHTLTSDEAYNKLRTLYRGAKKDSVIKMVARTFVALCEYADFEHGNEIKENPPIVEVDNEVPNGEEQVKIKDNIDQKPNTGNHLNMNALQYHINIVLPDTRDQAVYDAIFKSLRDHLG